MTGLWPRGFLSLTRLWREGSKGSEGSEGVVAADAAGCVEGLHRFAQGAGIRVLKMDRPDGRRVLKFDGLSGRGLRIALTGNTYKVSVTDSPFCIIWYDKHSGDWLAALATPYPGCAGLLHGKACHTILRSLCSLTNRVPLPPHPGDRIKHRETLSS